MSVLPAGEPTSAPIGRLDKGPALWDQFDKRRASGVQLSVWDGDGFVEWSWDDWRRAASRAVAGLRAAGVERGARVACVLSNSPESCAVLLGVWMAGGIVVSLPGIARGCSPGMYLKQLAAICADSEVHLVAADREVVAAMSACEFGVASVAFTSLLEGSECIDPTPPPPGDDVFIQYSSGSTSDPRGCVLSAEAIAWQLGSLERALGFDPEVDHVVSWLPLSHDMGLFGCLLLSYWTGFRLTLSSPSRFLRRPLSWIEDCSRAQATTTATPNFGLDVAARFGRGRLPGPFPMRRCIVGGERIELDTLRRVNEVFGDARFPLSCFVPAYGLAEVVLAAAMAPVGRAPRAIDPDDDALQAGQCEAAGSGEGPSLRLVSCGRPLPGVEITTNAASGVGEITVRSPSIALGYLGRPDLSRQRFTAGGVRTGDLGLLDDGELFVLGRMDDMFCVAGRNVYARDVEIELGKDPSVRAGCCALVSVDLKPSSFVVMAELHDEAVSVERVARDLSRVVRRSAGISVAECRFVPRGTLPKTPSGKLQRFRCRELALDPPPGTRSVVP